MTVTEPASHGVEFLSRVRRVRHRHDFAPESAGNPTQPPADDTLTFIGNATTFTSPLSAFVEAAGKADFDRVLRPVRRGDTVELL